MKTPTFTEFWERMVRDTDIQSQVDLGRLIGVGKSSVSFAKSKNSVPRDWIWKLEGRGFATRWLLTGEGSPYAAGAPTTSTSPHEAVQVPKVTGKIAEDGKSFDMAGKTEANYSFHRAWIAMKGDHRKMVMMSVAGKEMAPEIREGDMVLVDTSQQDIVNGAYYVLNFSGTAVIRRIDVYPDRRVLTCESPDFSSCEIQAGQNVEILGRVIWSGRDFLR